MKKVKPSSIDVSKFKSIDTLWITSSLLTKNMPNWQGFMSEIVNGHYECTAITFNPMVPLNPETNEAIYSTMSFVKEQAEQI